MGRLRAFLERWKPRATARAQLRAAALLWTVVGLALGAAGVRWCLSAPSWWKELLVGAGVLLGLLKGLRFITPVAHRNIARLIERGDGHCIGGFLSWRSWLFVLAMMTLGIVLRRSPTPRPALGVVYTAIGLALLTGSFPLWRARPAPISEAGAHDAGRA